jgi:hypothetical protein
MTVVAELDEVTFDLEVDGEPAREQLARRVWESKGRATVACAYRERKRDGSWRPAKVVIMKFRRANDMWKRESTVTLDAGVAVELAGTIEGWRELVGGGGDDDSEA